jgi:type VI secretion system VgrG family protein
MINFQFVSEALPDDTFQVLQFDAEEEVSQLFHVELRLVSRDPNIDFDLMLERAARLSIITEGKQRNIHGMLAEFEQGGEWQNGLYEYRALLVPRLWMLSQSTQNQIYQDQTVLDIVASELKNVNKKGSNPLAEAGLGSDADYEAFTIRGYEEREYVVQYKETDLNFISRLMEHEGLYYYFEHKDDCEKLVITDTFAEEDISDNSEALFQSEASGVRYDNRVVYKLSRMQKQIPSSVLVKDFNYRSPSLPMQAMGDINERGIGFVTEFGAHFKSPEEGEALATVRAEEFKCRQNTYSGESNISDFSCGHVYSLSQHFRSDYNQRYMLTKVKHQGSQEIESWGNIGSTKYSNQFDCIPALLQFRPQRLAVKPRLFGIMNGVIDSEQDLGRADLDEQGRYKVQMPFDISGVASGMASRRIRMAQPYGGGGSGMSFPLLKGTEVVWTCIDGDIDRPIITGTVPNPLNPSVTNTENATSNVIKTSSGISMGFHDGSGRGDNKPSGSGDGLAAQQQNQKVPQEGQFSQGIQYQVPEASAIRYSAPVNASTDDKSDLQLQQQMAGKSTLNLNSALVRADETYAVETGKQFTIGVPDYEDEGLDITNGSKDSYLRLGNSSNWEKRIGIAASALDSDDDEKNDVDGTDKWINELGGGGWFDYTDGDRVSVTQGKRTDVINGGNYDLIINNGGLMTADAATLHRDDFRKLGNDWRRTTEGYLSADTYTSGDSEDFFCGFKFDGMVGLSTTAFLGGQGDFSLGVNAGVSFGLDINLGYSHEVSFTKGNKYSSCDKDSIEATNKIELFVEKGDSSWKAKAKQFGIAGAGLAAGAAVGIGAYYATRKARGTNSTKDGDVKVAHEEDYVSIGIGASAGLYATAAAIAAAIIYKNRTADKKDRESQIVLDDTVINLQAGNGKTGDKTCSNIDMEEEAITLTVGKSGITITSDEIFIYADKINFGPKDKTVAATLTSDGFKLKAGNMDVDEGSLFVQEGITTEGLVDAKSIKSKSGKIGSYDSK